MVGELNLGMKQGTSFAGPRVEDGKNCSWWMVDVGEDQQVS